MMSQLYTLLVDTSLSCLLMKSSGRASMGALGGKSPCCVLTFNVVLCVFDGEGGGMYVSKSILVLFRLQVNEMNEKISFKIGVNLLFTLYG